MTTRTNRVGSIIGWTGIAILIAGGVACDRMSQWSGLAVFLACAIIGLPMLVRGIFLEVQRP